MVCFKLSSPRLNVQGVYGGECGGIVVEHDSESRGPGFVPLWHHCVVSLSKTH